MYRDPIKSCRSRYIILQILPIILVDKGTHFRKSNNPVVVYFLIVDRLWTESVSYLCVSLLIYVEIVNSLRIIKFTYTVCILYCNYNVRSSYIYYVTYEFNK